MNNDKLPLAELAVALTTIRIILCGATGSGKASLMEAITRSEQIRR